MGSFAVAAASSFLTAVGISVVVAAMVHQVILLIECSKLDDPGPLNWAVDV